MAARPWHLLSLCDGYGGTELALRSVAPVRTVCRVERDAYAAAILVERMGQARLDQCPIWDDVATFDGAAWRGRVDIVAAGFPCPDFSSAGRRAGVDGEHWLWPECFEVIRQVGPSIVLLENVPGLVRLGGLTRVLSDLALYGFNAEWGLYSAAAVGAPHQRERAWIVGYAPRQRCEQGDGPAARQRWTDRTEATVTFPPGRDDHDGWAEWIATGGPQPVLRRLTDGPPVGLADALHLGGNGLVPQCAAHAWGQLLERGGWLT